MKYIMRQLFAWLVFLSITSVQAQEQVRPKNLIGSIQMGTGFESNVYYDEKRDVSDALFRFKPDITFLTAPSNTAAKLNVRTDYRKYFSQSNLDQLDYGVGGKVDFNQYGRFSFSPYGDYQKVSDRPMSEYFKRTDRTEILGGAKLEYKWTDISSFVLDGGIKQRAFATRPDPNLDLTYLNSQSMYGSLEYVYRFLPETNLFISGEMGTDVFPDGKKYGDDTLNKYNSSWLMGSGGVNGRLTQSTSLKSKFSYLMRMYEKEQSFNEPVFFLEFTEQLTPKEMLIAGFDYNVEDSLYSNYVLSQTVFLGYGKVYGDQVLLLARLHYSYKSFSKINRREDQRIFASFKGEYSFNPHWKFVTDSVIDLLSSDAVDRSARATNDPNANYKFVSLLFSLSYVF